MRTYAMLPLPARRKSHARVRSSLPATAKLKSRR
jgi:hypothetical protein